MVTGIRFCQQSLFLHQAAMASPSYSGCERKMFPVHPLHCWYSLALAAPHSKCFLTWRNRTLRSTLRHSPSRRLPGLRQHADMTEHGLSAQHNSTSREQLTLHHHGSGLWSGVCTNYFSKSRGSDSIHCQHLTLAAVQAIEEKEE